MDQLTDRAAGLFVWVKAAMEFMEEEGEANPDTKLGIVLAGNLGKATDNVDTLYRQILHFHFGAFCKKDGSGANFLSIRK